MQAKDKPNFLPRLFAFLFFFLILGIIIVYQQKKSLPVSYIQSNVTLPIYCVDTKKKQVALSFDAAWGNEDLNSIREILKKHHVQATFFVTGSFVKNYPEDIKNLFLDGHDIGNHSQNHRTMSQMSDTQIRDELIQLHEQVKSLTGFDMTLFRFPYGDYNTTILRTVYACGYVPIQWSVDSLDWKDYGSDAILNQVCNHPMLKNGAIILCHNGTRYTAKALDSLLTELEKKGYQIVPVSKLIYKQNYHVDFRGTQFKD